MSRAFCRVAVVLGSATLAVAAAAGQPGGANPTEPASGAHDGRADEPLPSDHLERVDVQLVLVDLLVLDRSGRTVPGLELRDFLLVVDGRDTEPVSLDTTCTGEALAEPRAGGSRAGEEKPATAAGSDFVLVFDYFHMQNAAEGIDAALDALSRWSSGAERHMVVALSQTLRVESPLTTDRDAVRRALERMRANRTLYAGAHDALTLHRFFERLQALYDLLERVPGRKTIVLFSGPLDDDGFFHDEQYRRLSALSTMARAAIYPVDTGGLRTPTDPLAQPLGGQPRLRRLATETGGRMTADTNDVGLAYARARRDLHCVYTIGFLHDDPRLDRAKRLTVRLHRPAGRRVVHPEFYVVRSVEQKRRALARAAELAPREFEVRDGACAELTLVAPRDGRRWDALAALSFDPAALGADRAGGTWRVRGLLRSPSGALLRSFREEIVVEPGSAPAAVAWSRPLSLRPGRYTLSFVIAAPGSVAPLTVVREIVVPDIPLAEGEA